MVWDDTPQKRECTLLGQFLFFVAEVTAEKEGADCPGASKKL